MKKSVVFLMVAILAFILVFSFSGCEKQPENSSSVSIIKSETSSLSSNNFSKSKEESSVVTSERISISATNSKVEASQSLTSSQENSSSQEQTSSSEEVLIDSSTYTREGDYILFGSYPQTKVSSTSTISALNSLAGTLPTSSNSYNWTSYGYYISGSVTNFMWYIDKEYNDEKYRGVYFTQYRPYFTTGSIVGSAPDYYSYDYVSSESYKVYQTSTAYWFKYEPLKWRILTTETASGQTNAMLLCESIIDSQQYDYDGSYSNNYANSTIRSWLNDTFYETAFNSLQQEIINVTTVDNSIRSTNPYQNVSEFNSGTNNYACSNTQDKLFLLSQYEVTNTNYDFSTYSTYDSLRQKKNTDYAKVQGCWTSMSSGYEGNGGWWLRSPSCNSCNYAWSVFYYGGTNYEDIVKRASRGVVPALWIRL